ncbi:hypothetical protein ABBQ38_000067 [Trebouxia sp. C0009 RCD-2024]
MEQTADPWKTSWDTAAPDDLSDFLHDVLLKPIQPSKPSSRLHKQDMPAPQIPLRVPSNSSSHVRLPKAADSRCMPTNFGGATAAPSAVQQPPLSLDTPADRSPDSQATSATADFSHAYTAQPTGAQETQAVTATADFRQATRPQPTEAQKSQAAAASADFSGASSAQPTAGPSASLQTPGIRKRTRSASRQTDAQAMPDNSTTQPAVEQPSKKMKGPTGRSSARPVLSPGEVAQAARDGVVFAKFAKFAHWPAQVSTPNQQQRRELGPLADDQCFVIFFGQNDYQYVTRDRIISFEAGLAKRKSGKSLDVAVKEAITYLKGRVTVQ